MHYLIIINFFFQNKKQGPISKVVEKTVKTLRSLLKTGIHFQLKNMFSNVLSILFMKHFKLTTFILPLLPQKPLSFESSFKNFL